jgi:hypothetical protein
MTIIRGSPHQLFFWGLQKASQAPAELWSVAGRIGGSPCLHPGVGLPALWGSFGWFQTAAAAAQVQTALVPPPNVLPIINLKQAQRIKKILARRVQLRNKTARCAAVFINELPAGITRLWSSNSHASKTHFLNVPLLPVQCVLCLVLQLNWQVSVVEIGNSRSLATA